MNKPTWMIYLVLGSSEEVKSTHASKADALAAAGPGDSVYRVDGMTRIDDDERRPTHPKETE